MSRSSQTDEAEAIRSAKSQIVSALEAQASDLRKRGRPDVAAQLLAWRDVIVARLAREAGGDDEHATGR